MILKIRKETHSHKENKTIECVAIIISLDFGAELETDVLANGAPGAVAVAAAVAVAGTVTASPAGLDLTSGVSSSKFVCIHSLKLDTSVNVTTEILLDESSVLTIPLK